jgi:hypothetical protein
MGRRRYLFAVQNMKATFILVKLVESIICWTSQRLCQLDDSRVNLCLRGTVAFFLCRCSFGAGLVQTCDE